MGRIAFVLWVPTWMGCALSHGLGDDRDAGRDTPIVDAPIPEDTPPPEDTPDSDRPDAPTPILRCRPIADVARPAMCDLDGRCDNAIDERPLAPAERTLDRPSIDIDARGRPIFLTARAEDPSIGALVTRDDIHPWIFERLTTSMVRGAFTPGWMAGGSMEGGPADGEPCATVFVDDGRGTIRVVEHAAEGDEIVDAFSGTLGDQRQAARTEAGVFTLFLRDGLFHVGFRGTETAWRDIALPAEIRQASLAGDSEGVELTWLTAEGLYTARVTGAEIQRGEGLSSPLRLASLATPPDGRYTPAQDIPEPHLESSAGAIFASDAHGDLVLRRRTADGAWTEDLVGDGSVVECEPATVDATCSVHYATHRPVAVVSNDEGDVAGLFLSDGYDVELVGGYWREPDPFEGYDHDAGPFHGPDWLWGTSCCAQHALYLVFAEAGQPPRTVLFEENTLLSDAALALGADGALHLVIRAAGGHRYIERRPHGR